MRITKALWSDEEERILTEMIEAQCDASELLAVFPYRSESSIRSKMRHMGLHCSPQREINREEFKRIMAARRGN